MRIPMKPSSHAHRISRIPDSGNAAGLASVATRECDQVDSEYFAAVERLIADGRVLRQKEGVLYAIDGSVQGYDTERVTLLPDGSYVLLQ